MRKECIKILSCDYSTIVAGIRSFYVLNKKTAASIFQADDVVLEEGKRLRSLMCWMMNIVQG
jgi:hypothetical protein